MPLMPGAEYAGPIPGSNFASSGGGKIGVAVHVIVGSGSSALGEFKTPGVQLSAHFIVAGPNDAWPDGHILQVLDTDQNAYAQGNGNYPPIACIAIEFAGTPDVPMSGAQMTSGAAICAWASKAHGFPLVGPVEHGTPGCTTHCHPNGQADPAWGDHPCPGLLRLAQIPQMVQMAQGNTPKPSPQEAHKMPVSQAFSFADGKTHMLQVSANHLWHKWSVPDSNVWGSEDVFAAAGVPHVDIPDQLPQWSILQGGKLAVTVQDANLRAWFFVQAAGGKWGANELP